MKLPKSQSWLLIALTLTGCDTAPTPPRTVAPQAGISGQETEDKKALYYRGVVYLNSGDNAAAIQTLRNASVPAQDYWDREHNSQVLVSLCEAYRRNGQYVDAIEACKRSLESGSLETRDKVRALESMAVTYLWTKSYSEAIFTLKRAIEIDPGSSSRFLALAYAYNVAENYDGAIAAAKHAIGRTPRNPAAYIQLGLAHGAKKQYADAELALKTATQLDHRAFYAYYLMGLFLTQHGAFDQAVSVYQRGIERAAESAEADRPGGGQESMPWTKVSGIETTVDILYLNLARLQYRAGKYDEAIATAGIILARQGSIPNGPDAISLRAQTLAASSWAHRHKGSPDAALKEAETAYSYEPGNIWVQRSLGAAYLDRGRFDDAIRMLSQVNDNATARILEATAYAGKGQIARAMALCVNLPADQLSPADIPQTADRMALLRIFKPTVKQHLKKARSFEAKEQYAEALSELAAAYQLADDLEGQAILDTSFKIIRMNPWLAQLPIDAKIYAQRSEKLVKSGEIEAAATELMRAIKAAPFAARLYCNSALVHAELGDYPRAIRHMRIYLRAAPNAPDSSAVKNQLVEWEHLSPPPDGEPRRQAVPVSDQKTASVKSQLLPNPDQQASQSAATTPGTAKEDEKMKWEAERGELLKRAEARNAVLIADTKINTLFGASIVAYAAPGLSIDNRYIVLPESRPVKVVTVDFALLYDSHPGTQVANAKFRAEEQEASRQVEKLNREGQSMVDEYQVLVAQAGNTSLASQARSEAEAAAQRKLQDIQRKQSDVKEFRTAVERALQQRIKTQRDDLLAEIIRSLVARFAALDVDLVIDRSGPTIFGVSPVVYADPSLADTPSRTQVIGQILRVGVMDLAQVYDSHPKTQAANASFRAEEQEAAKQVEKLTQEGRLMLDEYQVLVAQAGSTSLASQARSDAEAAAQRKMASIQRNQSEVKEFRAASQRALQQRIKTHRDLLLAEIVQVGANIARNRGLQILLDTSGPGLEGLPPLINAPQAENVTQHVIAAISSS
jgi:tetratricopeptide (TPR) repeat protein